jgi:glycosyltransferase involved in cell wall biosynthesis
MRKSEIINIKIITFGNFPHGGSSANFLKYFSLSLNIPKTNNIEVLLPTGFYYGKMKNNKRKGKIEDVRYRFLCFKNHPRNYVGKLTDNLIGTVRLVYYLVAQRIFGQLDVLIIYKNILLDTLPLLLIKKMLGIKLITIFPEFYEQPKGFIERLKWVNFYLGIKYLSKYSDGSIVLSNYTKKYIKLRSINKNMPFLILPNIMDPSIFEMNFVKKFNDNKITIGYAGTPTIKDGTTDLIRSFCLLQKKYKNIHLLIIGDLTNGKTIIPDLQKLAKDLGGFNNITFTGLIPFSEVPHLLNSCQILALTRPNGISAEAGFPTKLGEYFACKKAVVVTKVGDIPIYLRDNEEVILVEPENIIDIVYGFEKLILSEALRGKISKNAYEWMDSNLNYKTITKRLDDFINNVNSVEL